MALFADYEPERHGIAPPEGLETLPAARGDLPALAAIRATRDEVTVADATRAFERLFQRAATGEALVLAATVEGAVAGYGAAERLALAGLPEGWYLSGVVVAPEHRRRGIGARLTRARLDWIAGRASQAYYFVNERNRASIDLHARLGFRELVRDVRVPGVTFSNGVGLLFDVALPLRSP